MTMTYRYPAMTRDTLRGRCLTLHLLAMTVSVAVSTETLTLGYITGAERPEGAHPRDAGFNYDRPGQAISGAISLAVNEINKNPDLLPDVTLAFVVAETQGLATESLRQTALLWKKNVSVIIGPQETCVMEAKLAASLNLPMISYFCSSPEVSDKREFPTFARTRPPAAHLAAAAVSVLRHYGWTSVVLLSSDRWRYESVVSGLLVELGRAGVEVAAHRSWQGTYYHHYMSVNPFVRLVNETKDSATTYVVVGGGTEYVGLMESMQQAGLFDDCRYFVLGVHGDHYRPTADPETFMKGPFDARATEENVRAYGSYLGVIAAPPVDPQYQQFVASVNEYLESPPFSYPNPLRVIGRNKHLRPEAAYLYDAVHLYARAVQQARWNKQNYLDGSIINGYLRDQTYRSAMGYIEHTDDNGDAVGSYVMIGKKENPDRPETYGLFPVGDFRVTRKFSGTPHFILQPNSDWPDSKLPPPGCATKHPDYAKR